MNKKYFIFLAVFLASLIFLNSCINNETDAVIKQKTTVNKSVDKPLEENIAKKVPDISDETEELKMPVEIEVNPIKQPFLVGSNGIVCIQINNISGKIHIFGELSDKDKQKTLHKYGNSVFLDKGQTSTSIDWFKLDDFYSNLTYKVKIISDGNEYEAKEQIVMESRDDLSHFLENEEFGSIRWNDEIERSVINDNFNALCNLESDQDIANYFYEFAQDLINKPNATDTKKYDNRLINSIKVFEDKIGTSSEFSSTYAMLMRILGFPAKLGRHFVDETLYYHTQVFTQDRDWIIADVSNEKSNFGDCIPYTEKLKIGQELQGICLVQLYPKVEFLTIIATKESNSWLTISGIIKNRLNSTQAKDDLFVYVVFYDNNKRKIFSSREPLLTKDLDPYESIFFNMVVVPERSVDYYYVSLDFI